MGRSYILNNTDRTENGQTDCDAHFADHADEIYLASYFLMFRAIGSNYVAVAKVQHASIYIMLWANNLRESRCG